MGIDRKVGEPLRLEAVYEMEMLDWPDGLIERIRIQAEKRGIVGEEFERFLNFMRQKIGHIEAANTTHSLDNLGTPTPGAHRLGRIILDLCGFCGDLAFSAHEVITENFSYRHESSPDNDSAFVVDGD
ncbi:MAG: hypothetical protein OXL96_12455 [Candidatus Poribacteria bacterium]|nr:hypothetical protein [Candidatus Poribacteria bacterium]